jgi:hypothetical protein
MASSTAANTTALGNPGLRSGFWLGIFTTASSPGWPVDLRSRCRVRARAAATDLMSACAHQENSRTV